MHEGLMVWNRPGTKYCDESMAIKQQLWEQWFMTVFPYLLTFISAYNLNL